MSHEIRTRAGSHVWGKMLDDLDIDEEDIRAIEEEAGLIDKEALVTAIRNAPMLDFRRSDGIERYALDLAVAYDTAVWNKRRSMP